MQALPSSSYRFDNFELDLVRRRLLRNGETVPLNPKAFDMLRVLVEHNGDLITKEDLFRLVWQDQIVEESNLTVNMSAIRKALGETATSPRYITTVSGRGYYFTANVEKREPGDDLVFERSTLSRLTVSDETEIDDEQQPPQLPPAPVMPRPWWLLALAVIAVSVGTSAYLLVTRTPNPPFSKMQLRRLTSNGRVTVGTLSPDGKLFAYSHQQPDGSIALWLEHIDGTQRVELRPAAQQVISNVAFTPDGSQLYYSISSSEAQRSGLYRIPAFGGPPEFVKEGVGRISFSPDGKRYAFVRSNPETRGSTITISELATGAESVLIERPAGAPFAYMTIDWSRDGKYVAASAVVDEATREQEIFVIDIATGQPRQLTSAKWNGVRSLAWHPDGAGIIASAGEQDALWEAQLWHVALADGSRSRLVADLNTYGIVLSLSADGKSLLTVQAQFFSNIWIAPANDLGAARQVTFDMLGRQNGWDGIDWTPAGQLLFTSYVDKSESIWMLDLSNNSSRQVIPSGRRNTLVSVSASGSIMAFDSNRSGTSEVWVAEIDGSKMRQLTRGGNNGQCHISPDGRSVVYQSIRDGKSSLWKIDTVGGEAQQLIDRPASWPQYSRDGRYIAAAVWDGTATRVGIFEASGGEPIKLFDFPPQGNARLGIHWIPDGSGVTYRDWSYGIWYQPLTGDEPTRLKGLPEEKIYAYAWSRDGAQFAYSRGMEIRDVVLITEDR